VQKVVLKGVEPQELGRNKDPEPMETKIPVEATPSKAEEPAVQSGYHGPKILPRIHFS
jgi:hypothetical protein